MTRSAADIRKDFIDFFTERGHTFVPGSPVVPYDDPTLLFTNAGMNQFKDVFLATGTRSYNRAANSQPCIRAGGKHNDLDDVGQDTYHHTFFEMLGNWSFGDYFKKEAIEWAWELLTDVWGLDKTRLHATYFEGNPDEGLEPDSEAKELWASVTDIDPTHIHPGNKKDNFWEMGDVGPCGPCSEVHIDLTPDKSGAKLVNVGDARVIEIWNLVFIQFNRDASGNLTPLPAKHVDTGMGFERVTALLQGKASNYDTDVFAPIFDAIRGITGAPPYRGMLPEEPRTSVRPVPDETDAPGTPDSPDAPDGLKPEALQGVAIDQQQLMTDISYRVIADHARCLTFAINDGCMPDREGRGYVLRRILRRAVRYGWQYFNMHEPFLHKLVPTVVATLGDAFPQLKQKPEQIAEIIREEEESFDRTLDRGIALFEEAVVSALGRQMAMERGWTFRKAGPVSVDNRGMPNRWSLWFQEGPKNHEEILMDLSRDRIQSKVKRAPVVSGEDAFKLHDTYGFPIDLTQIMAEEKGLTVDIAEYERLMDEARERARAGADADLDLLSEVLQIPKEHLTGETDDTPKYQHTETVAVYLFPTGLHEDGLDYWLDKGLTGLVFDRTCFYAEQGGQVGDQGYIEFDGIPPLRVIDTKLSGKLVVHLVDPSPLTRHLKIGAKATLRVDTRRRATMQNHTATHVMNWALREVLGDHVQQKGSLVDPDKTRFDFSHSKGLTPEEIERVEQLVNEKIAQNLTVYDEPVEQGKALKIHGLRAVFGEKYPDVVRVMSIGTPVSELVANPDNPEWQNVSIEFCGGTHCQNTGQIGHFAIVSEEAVAKGIRRVVGITGDAAQAAIDRGAELLKQADDLRTVRTADHDVASAPRGRRDAAAGPHSSQPGAAVPHADLATRVAELQQAIADETLRVVDRARLRDTIAELQKIVREQQKVEAAAVQDAVTDRINELLADAPKVGDTTVFVAEMPDVPIDQLKTGADMIKQKCGSAAVLFGVRVGATKPSTGPERAAQASAPPTQGKALLLAAMSNDLIERGIKAGDLVKQIARLINGGGGGPPSMAQAGGKDPSKIPDALEAGKAWIEQRL